MFRKSGEPKKPGNLWRLMKYVKPYWHHFAGAAAAGLLKMLTPVAIAWIIGRVVNILTAANAGQMASSAAWMELRHLALLMFGIILIAPIPIYLRSALGARAVQLVIRNLRCELYAHIQKLSHSFFDANRSGSLTSRIIGDVEQIQPFIGRAMVQVWMSLGLIAVVLGYFFSKSVTLGLISVAMIPVQVLIQRKIGWKMKANSKEIRDQLARLFGSTQEKLAAATIVKAYTGEDEEITRFTEDTGALVNLGVQNTRLSGLSQALMEFMKMNAQLLVILLGGYMALMHSGDISVGLLIQFILMQSQLYVPLDWLNEMQLIIAAALGATDRVFAIFDTEPEIADRPGAVEATCFTGYVEFEHIKFSYPTSSRKIFDDLNLTIPAKTTLALVGPSGGGKTTVTYLLDRFYEWDEGSIRIDGCDIRDYTIFSLRNQIGLVPQEPILFSGTVEENILYGRPGASLDEVREAAARAYAADFIEATENGYQTLLGERGVRLSGGERQRISIARAFLKDPAIIVLDEATSALDSESEGIVQKALEELMHNRTTLIIAHRLATVRNADQIAVIANGRVMELGRHEELLHAGGLYTRLCMQQFRLTSEE